MDTKEYKGEIIAKAIMLIKGEGFGAISNRSASAISWLESLYKRAYNYHFALLDRDLTERERREWVYHKPILEDVSMNVTEVAKASGLSHSSFYKAKEKLVKNGYFIEKGTKHGPFGFITFSLNVEQILIDAAKIDSKWRE